ncbi:hypothetical protein BDZ89DRAFT_571038 [Hymenopellis radicata]|nr:hypothetical protein BDZ89DRAFT_571038 [Hymenopellis radicata]
MAMVSVLRGRNTLVVRRVPPPNGAGALVQSRCSRSLRHEDREVPLLYLLMEHSSRWRHAEFMDMTLAEVLILGNVRGRITQLRTVRLDVHWEEDERTDIVSAFEVAPELSHVDLGGLSLDQVLLDKQNLQYLQVKHGAFSEEYPIYSLSNIIRASPKLTEITLYRSPFLDVVWAAPPPSSTPRSVYTNLTSLSVVEGESISVIALPNLTDLDVGIDVFGVVQGILPCVVSLLQHSRCRLSSLYLRFAEWMGMLLGLVPDLEMLSISSGGMPGTGDMMSVLMHLLGEKSNADGLSPKYVPRLEMLEISLFFMARLPRWTFTDNGFLDMVAMREEHGALEVVELDGDFERGEAFPPLCSDDLKRWMDMCEKGLIVATVMAR